MINENGQFELLTTDEALEIARDFMIAVGYTITSGSVEEQMQFVFAQGILEYDKNQYANFQKYLTPQGTDLDLQNPNVPRLPDSNAQGYLQLVNATGATITVTASSIVTASNGNQYTTETNTVDVLAGSTNFIAVNSVEVGIEQNLIANTVFTSSYDLTVTNPQPFSNARNAETDIQYKNRLIQRRTDLSSYHATNTAETELKEFYEDAKIYVNNDATGDITPIPIPSNGYTAVVLTPSGVTASSEELNNAFQILSNRLQFGNSLKVGTVLHPILSGVIYAGNFPSVFYLIPAQSVEFTLTVTLEISFDSRTSEQEKVDLSVAFAQFFGQDVVNYFGGAAGNCNVTFNPLDPYEAPTNTTAALEARGGVVEKIAPSFSLEQVRALISEASSFDSVERLKYEAVTALNITLDPLEPYESPIVLDIGDTYVPDSVNFATNALFSDNTSWFDRYLFIDPNLITITMDEVNYDI